MDQWIYIYGGLAFGLHFHFHLSFSLVLSFSHLYGIFFKKNVHKAPVKCGWIAGCAYIPFLFFDLQTKIIEEKLAYFPRWFLLDIYWNKFPIIPKQPCSNREGR